MASFSHSLKGEASRYIFLTKFRKFLQENASGRGVGILQGGHYGLLAVLQGLQSGHLVPLRLPLTCLTCAVLAGFSSRNPSAQPWMRNKLASSLAPMYVFCHLPLEHAHALPP